MLDRATFQNLLEARIPFNQHLGVKLESFGREPTRVVTRLEVRPEFLGHFARKMPHGGLVAALVDATAGAAAALVVDDMALFERIATIDMRVDYLKPAKGRVLLTTSEVMRSGNRVIVVRSEVHDDVGTLVALGSNAFNVAR